MEEVWDGASVWGRGMYQREQVNRAWTFSLFDTQAKVFSAPAGCRALHLGNSSTLLLNPKVNSRSSSRCPSVLNTLRAHWKCANLTAVCLHLPETHELAMTQQHFPLCSIFGSRCAFTLWECRLHNLTLRTCLCGKNLLMMQTSLTFCFEKFTWERLCLHFFVNAALETWECCTEIK